MLPSTRPLTACWGTCWNACSMGVRPGRGARGAPRAGLSLRGGLGLDGHERAVLHLEHEDAHALHVALAVEVDGDAEHAVVRLAAQLLLDVGPVDLAVPDRRVPDRVEQDRR